jgi:hypothetical protein
MSAARRLPPLAPALALATLLCTGPAGAAGDSGPWTRAGERGEVISIDPTTQRATVSGADGTNRPLWDGVHRLEDGRTLIMRAGVVVQDVDMSASKREPMRIEDDAEGVSPCLALTRRVCGLKAECGSTHACGLAQQLLRFEEDERQERPDIEPQTVLRQCRDALSNPTSFPGCPANATLSEDSPCRSLLRRVCGKANECAEAPACRAARQLGEMEIEERLSAAQPELNPRAAGQCTQALLDKNFFLPCR